MDRQDEKWLTVPEFPMYMVSNFGRVMSTKFYKERIIIPTRYATTYALTLYDGKRRKRYELHRLVLLVFRPIPDAKLYKVVPKDGDFFNVHVDNLEWRLRQGSNHPRAKLTEEQVIEMHELYRKDKKQSYATLAKRYKVGQSTIGFILGGQTWTHVTQKKEMVK